MSARLPSPRLRLASSPGILWLALLGGCAAVQQKPDHSFDPAKPVALPPVLARTGGIYHPGYAMALFQDVVAHRVGDNLTINLEEKTAATKQADTALTKNSTGTLSMGLSGATIVTRNGELDTTGKRQFTGNGQSQQSNSLTGNITVVVSQVLANGNLVVRGEKQMTLNQGEEYIQISGIVRPADISPDNTVPSYLVADARITYSGKGQLAEANQQGWLSRFFMSPWFPL